MDSRAQTHQVQTARPGPSRPQRLALIAFGLGLALLVIELGLRLGGAALWRQQHTLNAVPTKLDPDRVVVLCIGESTTALGGRDAYPRQLQKILERRDPDHDFVVLNEGRAATTSSLILQRLPKLLKTYRPDVVISMMGVNDHRFGLADAAGPLPAWQERLASLRVVKLFRLLSEHLSNRLGLRAPPPPRSTEATPTVPRFDSLLLEAALKARQRGLDPATALQEQIEITLRDLEIRPRDSEKREALVLVLSTRGQAEKAWKLATTAPVGAEVSDAVLIWVAERLLEESTRNERRGSPREARRWLRRALKILPPSHARHLRDRIQAALVQVEGQGRSVPSFAARQQDLLPATTADNYARLARLLESRGIALVAVQYPRWPVQPLASILEQFPQTRIVDNQFNFELPILSEGYWALFNDRFAGDFGHMTPRGAGILAEQIATTLLDQDLIGPTARRQKSREESPTDKGRQNNGG